MSSPFLLEFHIIKTKKVQLQEQILILLVLKSQVSLAKRRICTFLCVLGPEECWRPLKQCSLENFISLIPRNTQLYSGLHGKDRYFSFILQKPQAHHGCLFPCCGVSVTQDEDYVEFSQISFKWLSRIGRYEVSPKLCADPSSAQFVVFLLQSDYSGLWEAPSLQAFIWDYALPLCLLLLTSPVQIFNLCHSHFMFLPLQV